MTPVEIRVVRVAGSTPRDVGASMVVTKTDITGTIGGGRLEFDAIKLAREGHLGLHEVPLGPEIGQCCGGVVTLEFSRGTEATTAHLLEVYIFGAGHVGQALALALTPLPLRVVLVDQREAWLNKAAVETVLSPIPEKIVQDAGPNSCFVVVTHEHGLDFLIVEEALKRGDAAYIGMIGSKSKRSVLEKRLRSAGVDATSLRCPIGRLGVGDKRPEVIAAFVSCEILLALRDL